MRDFRGVQPIGLLIEEASSCALTTRKEAALSSSFQSPGCTSCWQCSKQGSKGLEARQSTGSVWAVSSLLYTHLSLSLSLSPALSLLCVCTHWPLWSSTKKPHTSRPPLSSSPVPPTSPVQEGTGAECHSSVSHTQAILLLPLPALRGEGHRELGASSLRP